MNFLKFATTAALSLTSVAACFSASPQLLINSFPGNGQLTWTNLPGTNAFTVEWAPAITGAWHRGWETLDSVVRTGSQTTVSVPMFYRVSKGFTEAALRGPWMLTGLGTNLGGMYLVFDGAGIVEETGSFIAGIPSGYYSVQTNGAVIITFTDPTDGAHPFPAVFTSQEQLVSSDTPGVQANKIPLPSLCQGHWTGNLLPTAGAQKTVSFDVGASGLLSNFAGLPSYVVGRMFSDSSNRVSSFFRTGASNNDPYRQVQVKGTLSNNIVTGIYYLDVNGEATLSGTVTLQRQ